MLDDERAINANRSDAASDMHMASDDEVDEYERLPNEKLAADEGAEGGEGDEGRAERAEGANSGARMISSKD